MTVYRPPEKVLQCICGSLVDCLTARKDHGAHSLQYLTIQVKGSVGHDEYQQDAVVLEADIEKLRSLVGAVAIACSK